MTIRVCERKYFGVKANIFVGTGLQTGPYMKRKKKDDGRSKMSSQSGHNHRSQEPIALPMPMPVQDGDLIKLEGLI
jgi:hypothetical protein